MKVMPMPKTGTAVLEAALWVVSVIVTIGLYISTTNLIG